MKQAPYQITTIGHATTLIKIAGRTLLTDPNFSKEIFLKGKRLTPPGLKPEELPKIDAILISHACYDHLDLFSYKFFSTHVPVLCPKGLGKFIGRFLPNPITEIPHGKHHELDGIKIHAVEIKKKGYRWVPWRNTGANGYVIESPEAQIYFAGNTAYGTHFKKVGERFNPEMALLPLATRAKDQKKKKSLNPGEFLKAGEKLHAKILIPIRWGVFQSSKEEVQKAREELEQGKTTSTLHWLEIGETFKGNKKATQVKAIKLASVEGKRVGESSKKETLDESTRKKELAGGES